MLTSSLSLEEFWGKTRNNLFFISNGKHKNFWLYELSVWLHMLANTMLAIYIPIIMLQAGFAVSDVLLFYVIFHLVNTPTNYLAGILVTRIGARKTVIIATLFQIAFFLYYAFFLSSALTHVLLLGVLAAVYDALYYTASLYIFMDTTIDVDNSGKNTGILYAVIRSASLVGPLVGSGVLLLTGNAHWVIAIVVGLFALSLVPLLSMSIEHGERTRMLPLREFLRLPDSITNHLSLGLFKIHEISSTVLWPMFIFLFFENIESVAALALLVPLVALFMSFFSGYIHRAWRYHAIALSAFAVSLIWIGRILFENPSWYYASVVMATTIMIFMQVPIDANLFRRGNETNPLSASVARNMFSMGIKTILFTFLWVLSISFAFQFALAALALLLLTLIGIVGILRSRSIAI